MNTKNIGQTVLAPIMAVLSLLFMSSSAMAHPGHDHGANESMLVHVLFMALLLLPLRLLCLLHTVNLARKKTNKPALTIIRE